MEHVTEHRLQALARSFHQEAPEADPSSLRHSLASALERCRQAWPNCECDVDAFIGHLAQKFEKENPIEALQTRHMEDLFLAFCCASGDPAALAAFAQAYDGDVDIACAKATGGPPAGEVRQQLYHKLFVAVPPAQPRILEYSGQGKLRGWFRVTVTRSVLDAFRASARAGKQVAEDHALDIPSPHDDPETQYFKIRYQHEFKESFERAVTELQPEQRNVLRSYYAKHMSIDEIATMFGIHRATAARRVNRAREALMSETRRHLTERLKLSRTELESVLRLIESQLHVSVERLLERTHSPR